MSRKPGDMEPDQRREHVTMQRLAGFAGQMTASSDYHYVKWAYLPQDTGNRVVHALANMPVVRIQLTAEVPNRDAYHELRTELRRKWGIFATIETVRLSRDLRGEPTEPNDMRVTVVKRSDFYLTELREIAQACKTGRFTLHLADTSDDAAEVIAQIKNAVRKWLTGLYV